VLLLPPLDLLLTLVVVEFLRRTFAMFLVFVGVLFLLLLLLLLLLTLLSLLVLLRTTMSLVRYDVANFSILLMSSDGGGVPGKRGMVVGIKDDEESDDVEVDNDNDNDSSDDRDAVGDEDESDDDDEDPPSQSLLLLLQPLSSSRPFFLTATTTPPRCFIDADSSKFRPIVSCENCLECLLSCLPLFSLCEPMES